MNTRTGNNRPPSFFSLDECDRLSRFISSGKGAEEEQATTKVRQVEWKLPRDLALVGVLLGGGLKLSEALCLTIRCITGEAADTVEIPHSPKTRGGDRYADPGVGTFERTVKLEPFAAVAMKRWLAIRNAVPGMSDDNLFPSTLAGKPLDVSNANRRIKPILEACNVTFGREARGSAQTLRNCHAANLFFMGRDDNEILQQMGWVDMLSVQRFRSQLPPEFKASK